MSEELNVDNNDVVEDEDKSLSEVVRDAYDKQKEENHVEEDDTPSKPKTKHPTEETHTETSVTTATEPKDDPKPVHTGLNAPTGWSAEAKADFSKLPAHVQQAIANREEQVNNGFKVLQNYKGLESFEPYIKNAKATYAQVLDNAIKWEAGSISDPIGTIIHLANLRGISVPQLIQAVQNPQMAAQFRRQVQHPQPKQYSPEEYKQLAREEYQKVQSEEAVNNNVNQFLADTKNYPHAAKLVDDMVFFINGGKATDLKSAYAIAIKLHPELTTAPNRNPNVAQAKKASKAVTGAPKSDVNAPKKEYGSVREALRAAYAEAAE